MSKREIARLLAARSALIGADHTIGGQPAARPLARPIVPLIASDAGTDAAIPGSRPAAFDALAVRTLVNAER
jgi:uncharacterized protein